MKFCKSIEDFNRDEFNRDLKTMVGQLAEQWFGHRGTTYKQCKNEFDIEQLKLDTEAFIDEFMPSLNDKALLNSTRYTLLCSNRNEPFARCILHELWWDPFAPKECCKNEASKYSERVMRCIEDGHPSLHLIYCAAMAWFIQHDFIRYDMWYDTEGDNPFELAEFFIAPSSPFDFPEHLIYDLDYYEQYEPEKADHDLRELLGNLLSPFQLEILFEPDSTVSPTDGEYSDSRMRRLRRSFDGPDYYDYNDSFVYLFKPGIMKILSENNRRIHQALFPHLEE